MKIEWTVKKDDKTTVKSFLKKKNISKRLLSKVKFQGGVIEVNNKPCRVRKVIEKGDTVSLTIPKESENDRLKSSDMNIYILFEDEHFLILNKPSGVASVPSSLYSNHTMANRVKGYIQKNRYFHQTVHIVTRLDKDTSGVMIFAKHSLAHSYLDRLLKENKLYKEYLAYVEDPIMDDWGILDFPIYRSEGSIIKRAVDSRGKESLTEYWIEDRYKNAAKVKVQLHTGRTHQIRVHFSHINHPLLGDTLYNDDNKSDLIDRQALHCRGIRFEHPFTGKELTIEAHLPDDLSVLESKLERIKSE